MLMITLVLGAIVVQAQGSLGSTKAELESFLKKDGSTWIVTEKNEYNSLTYDAVNSDTTLQTLYYFNSKGFVYSTALYPLSLYQFMLHVSTLEDKFMQVPDRHEWVNYKDDGVVVITMIGSIENSFEFLPYFLIMYYPN